MSSTEHDDELLSAVRIDIPERFYLLPGAALIVGTTIGLYRGSRTASLRFLAENAHRTPKTVRGWYLYNKTKNYRVLLGGLKGAGADATKLGLTAAGWVFLEEACTRLGLDDGREVAAGLGTGTLFGAVCECSPLFFARVQTGCLWDGGCRWPAVEGNSAHGRIGGCDRGNAQRAAVEQGISEGTGRRACARARARRGRRARGGGEGRAGGGGDGGGDGDAAEDSVVRMLCCLGKRQKWTGLE